MAENRDEVGFVRGKSSLPTFDPTKENLKNKRHPQNGYLQPQQKASSRLQHKPRSTPGGPGMQAIFLDSSKQPCGTGVFLPLRTGSDSRPSKKPACSPVLLPSRVVQTLNLNVYKLAMQTQSPRGTESYPSGINRKAGINKKGENDSSTQQSCVISHNRNTSPDIFLPKEWTY